VATDTLLRVGDVSKKFGDTVALQATTLEIERGSFVSVVGPSGCGKSTLFNVISGLIAPDEGKIDFDGQEITGRTGHVGYMLQKDLLVPWRTVMGNITLAASLKGTVRDEDRTEARRIADRYGLGEFLNHYPHSLSGGMRQRVALMRTLATNQPLLLLDEPFGALDSQTRLEMQQWLLSVWRDFGRTVLFVTHDVDEAVFLSDRVVVMSPRPGRVVADITIDLARPREMTTLTSPQFVDIKREILELLHGGGR
jgi:ABC-type nitrate/sulfonate/bicarbonate transport system ATPase subunit